MENNNSKQRESQLHDAFIFLNFSFATYKMCIGLHVCFYKFCAQQTEQSYSYLCYMHTIFTIPYCRVTCIKGYNISQDINIFYLLANTDNTCSRLLLVLGLCLTCSVNVKQRSRPCISTHQFIKCGLQGVVQGDSVKVVVLRQQHVTASRCLQDKLQEAPSRLSLPVSGDRMHHIKDDYAGKFVEKCKSIAVAVCVLCKGVKQWTHQWNTKLLTGPQASLKSTLKLPTFQHTAVIITSIATSSLPLYSMQILCNLHAHISFYYKVTHICHNSIKLCFKDDET